MFPASSFINLGLNNLAVAVLCIVKSYQHSGLYSLENDTPPPLLPIRTTKIVSGRDPVPLGSWDLPLPTIKIHCSKLVSKITPLYLHWSFQQHCLPRSSAVPTYLDLHVKLQLLEGGDYIWLIFVISYSICKTDIKMIQDNNGIDFRNPGSLMPWFWHSLFCVLCLCFVSYFMALML